MSPAPCSQRLGGGNGNINDVKQSQWFQSFTATTGGSAFYESAISQAQAWLSNPSNLFALGAGVLGFGVGVINAISTTMIVVVLTLYFLSSLETMKNALYQRAPAYGRPKLAELTEQITNSVGSAIAGGITLSILNATFSFILLILLGVPVRHHSGLPFPDHHHDSDDRLGGVLGAGQRCRVALLLAGRVAFVIIYFAYMQMEAYWLTPRIMGRAISVPGSLVLIGAMIGATLLGLLGALVAGPITGVDPVGSPECLHPEAEREALPRSSDRSRGTPPSGQGWKLNTRTALRIEPPVGCGGPGTRGHMATALPT